MILTYHAVNPSWRSPLAVSPEQFAKHCSWMGRFGRVLPAAEVGRRLASGGRSPARSLSVTFDDGFADLLEHALPSLLRYGVPATVFLVSGTLTEQRPVDWIDNAPTAPPATLTLDAILQMQKEGVDFGSHTHTHADLTALSDEECERELQTSKQALEDLLGRPISLLAYPRGLHDERVRRVVRRVGYSIAFGTSKRLGPLDPLAIPRVGVYADDGVGTLLLKTTPTYLRLKKALRR